jgi:hypothetical protein
MQIDIAGKERRIPDFIIAGAMKCGTTSLHHILAAHPLIFIPEPEIHFYDMDDLIQHRDSFIYRKNRWYYPSFSQDLNKSFNWYEFFFNDAKEKDFIGEDSPAYLGSEIAHRRIAEYAPETRIIVMLRDPVDRAYSQYCHLVLTGRLTCSFEYALQKGLGTIIDRSLYKKQIENFLMFLPRNNFHFILFEKFIKNPDIVTREVLQFLDIPIRDFDISKVETHRNKSLAPKNIRLS